MTFRMMAAAAALLLTLGPASAEALEGTETYNLLFREGTLDTLPGGAALTYRREVENRLSAEAAAAATGLIGMSVEETEGAPRLAKLEFRQENKHRNMGTFPASVGNPMIMVFYESVIRDMSQNAGGSVFYIRNRVKDALVQDSEAVEGEAMLEGEAVETRTVRLMPFAGDPNRDRMQGWGDLMLEVTMSDSVPGWYLSFLAEVPGADGAPLYRSTMTFDGLEEAAQ